MNKIMLQCPKTGKFLFTGRKIGDTDLKQILLSVDSATVPCLHCGQDHDMRKEKLSLIADDTDRT